MTISFQVVPATGLPFSHEPTGDSIVVGRSSDAEIAVPDRAMSRRHARLYRNGDSWYVEDLGSRNGTLLDGRRVEATSLLSPGSSLRIGSTTINVNGSSSHDAADDGPALDGHTVFRSAAELLQEPKAALTGTGAESAEALRRYA
ncbi:MAG TPA: FHA domain-containing protein, partial [Candidatus Sulfomarinibacteraceae bacterium]|nr:FHA domain-containing protein [Candidatus Sulfomarinibacteraceae bacterium]